MRANYNNERHRPETECAGNACLTSCYFEYAGELRAYITWKLPRSQDIEDLVQEVFLRACRAFRLEKVDHPRAYMYQVANSVICDHYRKSKRQCAPYQDIEEFDDSHTVTHSAPTPEEFAIGEETWQALCTSIDRLPNKVRQAITLRRFDHLSYREVAQSMGISVRTVEKHLARALNDLRDDVEAAT